jgi:hypothetical protein
MVWVEDPDATPSQVHAMLGDAVAAAGSFGDGTSICCELRPDGHYLLLTAVAESMLWQRWHVWVSHAPFISRQSA